MMRAAKRAAEDVAMQLRNFVVRRNAWILVEEEGSGIDPVGAAVPVEGAVIGVGAGRGAEIDVRAGSGALGRIVHRCVDADFGDGLGRRRWDGVADGKVDGCCRGISPPPPPGLV